MPAERRTSSRISASASSSTTTTKPDPSPRSKAKPGKSKLTPALPSTSATPSSSLFSSSATPKHLLLFKSLNVSSHNRIAMPILISHVLAFLQTQTISSSSSSSANFNSNSAPPLPITVTSYLQSGNLIISNLPVHPTPNEPPFSLPALESYLDQKAHVNSTLFLRTLPSLAHILAHSPFNTGPLGSDLETKVHVVFLEGKPGAEELEELRERVRKDGSEEDVWCPGEVDGDGSDGTEVVLLLPNGVGRAKCGAGVVEKVLGMAGTMRGWRSLRACAGLME